MPTVGIRGQFEGRALASELNRHAYRFTFHYFSPSHTRDITVDEQVKRETPGSRDGIYFERKRIFILKCSQASRAPPPPPRGGYESEHLVYRKVKLSL
jgi:hypothetical protein